ncbi:MAG: GspH/FimT family pseudopilin [Gammaproteobacteria bacterium]|nr:GspH/FimT family pseudopilin [Gammaproteobacteria bacterium]
MAKTQKRHGFTVVELMVTLAIAAVLVGYALPAFKGFVAQRTMTARLNDFVLAINFARSEAAKLGGMVSVQAVDDSDGDNEWGPGYCVVVGNPGNCAQALRRFSASANMTLDGIDAFDTLGTFSFNSRGLLTPGGAGALQLCSIDVEEDPGRVIGISQIGRTTTAELECNP